jgi:non-specific serine/threonine protein kinase
LGDAWGIGLVLNNHGYAAYNRGDTQRAINLIQESLPYLRQAADKRFLALVLQNLGELAQDQEDYDTVIFRYEESLSLFQEFGESLYAKDWVLRMWGDLALIRGDIEQADQVFRKRLRVCRESGNKYAMIETLERLTKVLEAQGKLQAATQLLSAAEALRRANDMPLPIPLQPAHERMAKGLRAGLGEAAFAKAWVGGQVLTLEQAYQFALSQSILDEPAPRPEPESIPARLPSRREATKQKYGGLTTKEREVAALVVQGKTNREIAEELFVGLKTVEAHITRILQKLGFTSRAQIAAWAVAKGLAEAPTDLDTLARGI